MNLLEFGSMCYVGVRGKGVGRESLSLHFVLSFLF